MAPSTATNPSQKPEWKVRPLTSLGRMLASVFMSSILPSVPLKARTAIFSPPPGFFGRVVAG